ncbi:Ribosomal protein S6--L-glutamate ligase [invertebrate metagenome]|uniref:Ribosomal protein S6--L-glutamate ligase n=1 Tax=invertebrate metagenome TaxID=1711999 RepID=A0A2H9TAQ3_9ZZZZ
MANLFSFFSTFTSPAKLHNAGVLGMNNRNLNFVNKYNERKLLPLVDDKLSTKKLAEKAGVDVPKMIGVIRYQSDIRLLSSFLEHVNDFVIKPCNGSGGKGILVIIGKQSDGYVKASGDIIGFEEVHRHASNILSGLYSLGGKDDVAMIETRIEADPIFNEYSYKGVPDIRTIVFKGFPIMTMMRLATKASDGKANLHQGAVGVGLDIATGKSLQAVQFDQLVTHHPDTGHDFSQLFVPHWDRLLQQASACYEMTNLGYIGVDMVLDKNLGPQILELNGRPGLAIQMANGTGIYPRLKRIEQIVTNQNLPLIERVEYAKIHFGNQKH